MHPEMRQLALRRDLRNSLDTQLVGSWNCSRAGNEKKINLNPDAKMLFSVRAHESVYSHTVSVHTTVAPHRNYIGSMTHQIASHTLD